MAKLARGRIIAIWFFLLLLLGAAFCFYRLTIDLLSKKYFTDPREIDQQVIFLSSYIIIILFMIRYGYYLAVDRVNWTTLRSDFIYLLNKKYFSKGQWMLNVLLFWLALIGFICSLAISAMNGLL